MDIVCASEDDSYVLKLIEIKTCDPCVNTIEVLDLIREDEMGVESCLDKSKMSINVGDLSQTKVHALPTLRRHSTQTRDAQWLDGIV